MFCRPIAPILYNDQANFTFENFDCVRNAEKNVNEENIDTTTLFINHNINQKYKMEEICPKSKKKKTQYMH